MVLINVDAVGVEQQRPFVGLDERAEDERARSPHAAEVVAGSVVSV